MWLLLTALLAWRILLAFKGLPENGLEITLAGIFLAWMTLTTAIHRALKPFRGKDEESPISGGLKDIVANGVEEGVTRTMDP